MVDVPTVIVIVDDPEPGAAMEAGLKLAEAPEGRPEAINEIAELNPPETVVLMVLWPEDPCAIVIAVGAAEMPKLGVLTGLTVSETVAVCVMPPPVPVTVTV